MSHNGSLTFQVCFDFVVADCAKTIVVDRTFFLYDMSREMVRV